MRHRSIDQEASRDDGTTLPSVVAQRRHQLGDRDLRGKVDGITKPVNSHRKHIQPAQSQKYIPIDYEGRQAGHNMVEVYSGEDADSEESPRPVQRQPIEKKNLNGSLKTLQSIRG